MWKYYKNRPDPMTEGKRATVFWDFAIQTDEKINRNTPDTVIKDY